jgi:hypothetical protein
MARNTKYNPELLDKICSALRAGNTRKASSEYAGISEVTFYAWIKTNLSFLSAVKKAEADAEVSAVAVIKKAMPDTWTAAAWWLERRKPDDYGRNLTLRADKEVTKALAELFPDDAADGIGSPPLGIEP